MGGASAEMVLIDVQQRTADQLFRTLGELKGGAMKFGQAMSIFEAALPDELAAPYREQLTKLQDSAPPMPTMTVREILARELGADWKDHLVELDPVPAAAASIGQVHKGRWVDGREVAVKVQYPGAAEALSSDLRQIARVARGLGPLVPGIDIKPLVEELQARAVEELDYQLESEAQRIFAEEFRDDPDIVIPDVVASAGTVLVTEWMESPNSLAHIIREGTQEERDHYGYAFLRFMFGAPARTGMLHADPHPGNFRLLPREDGSPGRLGVLDFGAVARLPERQLPKTIGALIRIATMENYDELVTALRDEGFIRERIQIDADQLRAYLGPVHRTGQRGGVPLLPRLDAGAVPTGQRPTRRCVRRHAAVEPACGVHAHPPHLRGRSGRAQPAGGAGAVPPGAPRLVARLRRLTARVPRCGR